MISLIEKIQKRQTKDFIWIVFEGIEFSGKTTQSRLLTKKLYSIFGNKVQFTSEPCLDVEYEISLGFNKDCLLLNSGYRKNIRKNLKSNRKIPLSDKINLFLEDRKILLKALKDSDFQFVVQDRCYISTLVYQTIYCNLDMETLARKNIKLFENTYDIRPNIIFWLKVDPKISIERSRNNKADLLDIAAMKNLQELHNNYQLLLEDKKLYSLDPKANGTSIKVIDANKPLNEVTKEIISHMGL